jgi:penicillin-binding protein 1B
VLDPRVAYLTTNMMEAVINGQDPCTGAGTGARAASPLPPRAKPAPTTTHGSPASPATCSASCGWATTTTPTSRIEGRARRRAHLGRVHEEGRAAAAILRHHEFTPPEGVEIVKIDKATNLLSDEACPDEL